MEKKYRSLESSIRQTLTKKKSAPKASINEAYDAEGGMARTQLMAIAQKAEALAKSLGEDEQLEAWIQTKISLADDYVGTVHDVMMHSKDKGRVK